MTDTVKHRPETVIHSCAHFGHVEIAEFLIDKGINVSAVDRLGGGALRSVMMGMHPKEAMATLHVEAGVNVMATQDSVTALHLAATTRNVRVVQCLLDPDAVPNAADEEGSRAVHMAAADSEAATVRRLLQAEKNVEIADHYGRTPLHGAAECDKIENVKVFLEMGADVSSIDRAGYTPLRLALYTHGNEASIHRTLHLGASMVDQSRETYVDCVPWCQVEEPNHMIVEALLAAGSDIGKLDDDNSPLRWAVALAYTTAALG